MASELVKPHHLQRRAVIYVRQSTPHQVLTNQESLRLQYALHGRARALGWHEADIEVIDSDLGTSGAASDQKPSMVLTCSSQKPSPSSSRILAAPVADCLVPVAPGG